MVVTLAVLAGRGPALLVTELARGGGVIPAAPSPESLAALVFLALGPGAVAQLLVLVSIRRVPAGRTAAALLLTPVSSALIAMLVLGEALTLVELAGGLLILIAVGAAATSTRGPLARGSPAAL